jgi:hypothetical protein
VESRTSEFLVSRKQVPMLRIILPEVCGAESVSALGSHPYLVAYVFIILAAVDGKQAPNNAILSAFDL